MLECEQINVEQMQRWALDPTPATYQSIQAQLECFAASLSRILANPEALNCSDAASLRVYLKQLPGELARLRVLMRSPLDFYQGLQHLRAAHFGSYQRSGELLSLEPKPFSRTILHL